MIFMYKNHCFCVSGLSVDNSQHMHPGMTDTIFNTTLAPPIPSYFTPHATSPVLAITETIQHDSVVIKDRKDKSQRNRNRNRKLKNKRKRKKQRPTEADDFSDEDTTVNPRSTIAYTSVFSEYTEETSTIVDDLPTVTTAVREDNVTEVDEDYEDDYIDDPSLPAEQRLLFKLLNNIY